MCVYMLICITYIHICNNVYFNISIQKNYYMPKNYVIILLYVMYIMGIIIIYTYIYTHTRHIHTLTLALPLAHMLRYINLIKIKNIAGLTTSTSSSSVPSRSCPFAGLLHNYKQKILFVYIYICRIFIN